MIMNALNFEQIEKILRGYAQLPAVAAGICNFLHSRYADFSVEAALLITELCCRTDGGDVCIRITADESACFEQGIEHLNSVPQLLHGLADRLSEAREEGNVGFIPDPELLLPLYARYGNDLENFTTAELKKALSCGAVGGQEGNTPLVFDHGRLYFRRNFEYENYVASFIKDRRRFDLAADKEALSFARDCLNELFKTGVQKTGDFDRQKAAAALALLSSFTVISGGPGTGKTTTVTKLLLLLLSVHKRLHPAAPLPRVMLCAPTGKAAGRLGQSLEGQLKIDPAKGTQISNFISKHGADELLSLIPRRASTVHSLIGVRPHSSHCRFNENNKLPCDILVVDEVSMVDLMLFKKLCAALREDAMLILLGDKDQLRSVEAGAVMADLCKEQECDQKLIEYLSFLTDHKKEEIPSDCGGHVMLLKKSFRFSESSVIGSLAFMVRDAISQQKNIEDLRADLLKLKSKFPQDDADLLHFYTEEEKTASFKELIDNALPGDDAKALDIDLLTDEEALNYGYLPFVKFIQKHRCMTPDLAKRALELLDKYRVLCSNRRGLFGCIKINREIKKQIMKRTNVGRGEWFAGRVVMATENSQGAGIHNGDVGFAAYDENMQLKVWFADDKRGARALSTVYLTSCEDAYAMTVHKSQGSEYARVVLALSDHDNSVMCRELVYTGITRAKQKLEIYSSEEVFYRSCLRSVNRESGLALRLTA